MNKLNNKGFTMIELLASITIMCVIVGFAYASYTRIIIDSKRAAYADAALNYIRNVKTKIANKEIDKAYNANATYYVDINSLTEDGTAKASPFGKWIQAYVVYVIDKNGNTNFYFTSLDEEGWMIKRVEESRIDKYAVVQDKNYESVDIEKIEDREIILLIDSEGDLYETSEVKAWTVEQTKACFSFRNLNANEVSLTYYNVSCLGEDGSVVIPAKVSGKKVTEIYAYTFYNMGIKSVSIPDGVVTIGESAFAYNQITNLRIPASVKTIGNTAFMSNQILNLKMTKNVTNVGQRAFQYNKLDKPLGVLVPNQDATIGACAFCNNFLPSASFLFSGSTVRGYVGDLEEFKNDRVFRIPAYNNEGVPITAIASNAFYGMSLSGYTVDIPEGITSIANHAFTFGGITKVNFPSTLKSIGTHSFYSNSLTQLNIPAGVTSIGSTAFNNNRVSNPDEAWIYNRTPSGIDYSTIIGYAGATKNNVVIPSSKNGVTLTALGPSALTYLGLTGSLTIPNTVKSYGDSSVFNNNSLTSVDNGDGVPTAGFVYGRNANGTVNKNVLYSYAGANKNPVVPAGVKEIGNYAFYYSWITSITFPEGLTSIGSNAFYVCSLSGTVTIPSTVTSIGSGAFYKAITWASMNGNLTKIINKTGRAFNWQAITSGPSLATFVTGTIENWYGNIEVTAS